MPTATSRRPWRFACAVLLAASMFPITAAADWGDGVSVTPLQTGHGGVQLFLPTPNDVLIVWADISGNHFWEMAQRMTGEGAIAPGWSAQGSELAYSHSNPEPNFPAADDGLGGVFQAVSPSVSGETGVDVYLWSARADGSVAHWPVATTAAQEHRPGIAGDGAGGAYVGWVGDSAIVHLNRFQNDGSIAPGWPADGMKLPSHFGGVQDPPAIAADGTGGAYVLWITAARAYVLHVTASGSTAAGWPAGGLYLGDAVNGASQYVLPQLFPSGEGWLAVWYGRQSQSELGIYVSRFLPDGTLDPNWADGGFHFPFRLVDLAPVRSTSDGQGGVTLVWQQAGLPYIMHVLSDGNAAPGYDASNGNSPLDAGAQYSSVNYSSSIMVATGHNGGAVVAWNDTRASGPGIRVRWLKADGTPDPIEVTGRMLPVADYLPLSGLIDDGNGGVYVVWNETDYLKMTRLIPSNLYGVRETRRERPPRRMPLELRALEPNPGSRTVAVRLTLPSEAPASLELLDLAGRRVRASTLVGPGERTERLDGLDALAPGVYLLKLTQGAASRSARLAIVR